MLIEGDGAEGLGEKEAAGVHGSGFAMEFIGVDLAGVPLADVEVLFAVDADVVGVAEGGRGGLEARLGRASTRLTAGFEYVGPAMEPRRARELLMEAGR